MGGGGWWNIIKKLSALLNLMILILSYRNLSARLKHSQVRHWRIIILHYIKHFHHMIIMQDSKHIDENDDFSPSAICCCFAIISSLRPHIMKQNSKTAKQQNSKTAKHGNRTAWFTLLLHYRHSFSHLFLSLTCNIIIVQGLFILQWFYLYYEFQAIQSSLAVRQLVTPTFSLSWGSSLRWF